MKIHDSLWFVAGAQAPKSSIAAMIVAIDINTTEPVDITAATTAAISANAIIANATDI